jgi:RNA-directed DNA polymerase
MQTKLHHWAAADPGRRFDDLFNFVHDPATLLVAFDRVAGNTGAPINNTNQMKHVSDLVSRAPEHARILARRQAKEGSGFFYEATLIADLKRR